MRFALPDLPAGWPWSLWFFAATLIVYLLQRFPLPGVFLMVVGAAFWSVILVNLGVIGIGYRGDDRQGQPAVAGRAGALFRRLLSGLFPQPGGARRAARGICPVQRGQVAAVRPGGAGSGARRRRAGRCCRPTTSCPITGSARAFCGNGRMALVGDKEACALLRGNDVYRSAGIYSTGLKSAGHKGPRWGPSDFA